MNKLTWVKRNPTALSFPNLKPTEISEQITANVSTPLPQENLSESQPPEPEPSPPPNQTVHINPSVIFPNPSNPTERNEFQIQLSEYLTFDDPNTVTPFNTLPDELPFLPTEENSLLSLNNAQNGSDDIETFFGNLTPVTELY